MEKRTPAILGGSPFFDPAIPFTQPTTPAWEEVAPSLEKMYRSGWLTKGPYLRLFEQKMADLLGVKYAIGVSSCTSGLILGLQALQLDKDKGEIIVPSFSFMATFHAIWWNGFKPVFVDCEPDTFTVDVEQMRRAITPRTAALAAVSVFGNPLDFAAIERLGEEYSLPVFYDSAHGLGTIYEGHPLGGRGSFESFSLSPTKLLTGGEGGLVTTNSEKIANHIIAGRDYGNPGSYECPHIGLNARMSEANAIIATKGADYLESYALHRNKVAQAYKHGLQDLPGLSFQTIRAHSRSSYKDFAVIVGPEFGISRDTLSKALTMEGIPNRAYFSPAGHKLACYADGKLQLPITERVSSSIICLPTSSHMDMQRISEICQVIHELYDCRAQLS
ncbi:MAG: DegT/DnrJ/EryC1/StrS family aminotransferase [Candidatus Bruticola sp.]